MDSLIAAKEKELARTARYKQRLYEDWKDGEISHSDYRNMREDYEQQTEGGDISIRFKFADEYRRVAEYIEANEQQKAAV